MARIETRDETDACGTSKRCPMGMDIRRGIQGHENVCDFLRQWFSTAGAPGIRWAEAWMLLSFLRWVGEPPSSAAPVHPSVRAAEVEQAALRQ